jgi:hypothetical protein
MFDSWISLAVLTGIVSYCQQEVVIKKEGRVAHPNVALFATLGGGVEIFSPFLCVPVVKARPLDARAILFPYLAGTARRYSTGAKHNEAALLTFHSQGAWMEALRAHNRCAPRLPIWTKTEAALTHHPKLRGEK